MYKYRGMYDYVDVCGHHDEAARARAKHVPMAGTLAAMAEQAISSKSENGQNREKVSAPAHRSPTD